MNHSKTQKLLPIMNLEAAYCIQCIVQEAVQAQNNTKRFENIFHGPKTPIVACGFRFVLILPVFASMSKGVSAFWHFACFIPG